MHGAALDWTVLCTLYDGHKLPTGETWHGTAVEDYAVYKLTKHRRDKPRRFHSILDVGSQDINGCMDTYNFLGHPPTWLERATQEDSWAHARTHYVGLDMQAGPNVDVVGNSHDMRITSGAYEVYFDLVLCLNMLEHDDDGAATLAACYRVMEPGGELVLVCTNELGAPHAHLGGGNTETFHPWTRQALRGALKDAGFERCEMWTHGGDNLVYAVKE